MKSQYFNLLKKKNISKVSNYLNSRKRLLAKKSFHDTFSQKKKKLPKLLKVMAKVEINQ